MWCALRLLLLLLFCTGRENTSSLKVCVIGNAAIC
jgi:hypothetical protein